jgi:biotin synthase
MKNVFLCSISNIESGTCLEDCKFCTQSVKYGADIERYSKKEISKIVAEAKQLSSLGATGFCLVTAGKGLTSKTLKYVLEVADNIKSEVPDLNLIACNGTATKEQLLELKRGGIDSYNHNLETSKEFYPEICSTHSWSERFETCQNVKEVGLDLCSGGIFGMGETDNDVESLLKSLEELQPESIPLNFFHHNPALPLPENSLSIDRGFEIISEFRKRFPKEMIMVAGGRESFFKERQDEVFRAGANSIVIGNYLTTKGRDGNRDIEMLKRLGLQISKKC